MKRTPALLLAAAVLAAGCASRTPSPTPVAPAPSAGPIALPDRIALPAAYRLMLLDGRLTLVRESDATALAPAPTSLRIVAGEISRGELAYQPGLLPQELAAEVATNRESAARMDNSLGEVMRRSRELAEQALALKAQSARLEELLSRAQARIAQLEGQASKAPPAETAPRE